MILEKAAVVLSNSIEPMRKTRVTVPTPKSTETTRASVSLTPKIEYPTATKDWNNRKFVNPLDTGAKNWEYP